MGILRLRSWNVSHNDVTERNSTYKFSMSTWPIIHVWDICKKLNWISFEFPLCQFVNSFTKVCCQDSAFHHLLDWSLSQPLRDGLAPCRINELETEKCKYVFHLHSNFVSAASQSSLKFHLFGTHRTCLVEMGADFNTKQVFCTPTPPDSQRQSDDESRDISEYLRSEDSTLSIEKAVAAFSKCNNHQTHADELKELKKVGSHTPILASEIGTDPNYKFTFVWFNLLGFVLLHIIGLSGALAAILGYCQVKTSIYCEYLWNLLHA